MISIYDVLKASKGIHVDDTFAELWGRKLSNAYTVATYTGTLPVTLRTVEGYLESYKIYGNAVQDGTPTPENPIMPSGCGERTENLFDGAAAYGVMYRGGVITGQAADINETKNKVTADMIGKTYTISITPLRIASRAFISITINGTAYWRENELTVNQKSSFKFTPVTENDQWYITYDVGGVCSYKDIMVNEGSTALPYIPYGYKLPILSNSVVTDIYLGEVETTRRIGKIDLGTLNWGKTQSGNFLSKVPIEGMNVVSNTQKNNALSNMFTEVESENVARTQYAFSSCLNNQPTPFVNSAGFEGMTLEEFKESMSGVYMYYVLAEPKTVVLNEPLMKIGDYADTIDNTQSTVQIPTSAGSTTISWAGEGLAPSEVKLTYRKLKGQ